MVLRIFSPPGTSPTPVLPALSVRMTMLRVKKGPCAPLRFMSMLSCPAMGTTVRPVTTGAWDSGKCTLLLRGRQDRLRAEGVDQRLQLLNLGGLELGKRRTDGTRRVAGDRRTRLHDAHRVAVALVADGDVRQEELVDDAVGGRRVAAGVRVVELDRGARDE